MKRNPLGWIEEQGIALQSARGAVPSFAEWIAGEPIRGSWWAHSRSHEIFRATEAVCDSGDVLVCRLVDGKITYVHRRLWPALVRLASRFDRKRLAHVRSVHTERGYHVNVETPFPEWVPDDVMRAAQKLSEEEAGKLLGAPAGFEAKPSRSRRR